MSRIGRKIISVPAGVKVSIQDSAVTITGPNGTLVVNHKPTVKVTWTESEKSIKVSIDETDTDNRELSSLWGTTRALIAAAIIGVTKGYLEEMEVVGVGWTAAVVGTKLKLVIGYAMPVMMDIPKDLKIVVDKQIVRISGADKQAVGMFASTMRSHRKPEPYNGKGVKYFKEVIKKKSGKAFGTA